MTSDVLPTSDAAPVADPMEAEPVAWPLGEVFREITRGGVAGLIVGIVVGGLGGRIAMRLAALIVPEATGSVTQNGNQIGTITLDGSVGLIVFGGLFVGIFVGTVWVVVRPWLPARMSLRMVAAIPLAIGLGSFGLIESGNADFSVLGHDAAVVGVLIVLIGLVGVAVVAVDAWLDRLLPHLPTGRGPGAAVYFGVSAIGALLILPLVTLAYLSARWQIGVALIVAGLATLTWWLMRQRGADRPPTWLRAIGTVAVTVATLLGIAMTVPEVRGALGIYA